MKVELLIVPTTSLTSSSGYATRIKVQIREKFMNVISDDLTIPIH